jgi:hypothetical protein
VQIQTPPHAHWHKHYTPLTTMSTADLAGRDYGDESEEEDFNPEPERDSDDERAAKPKANTHDDDDSPQRPRGAPVNEEAEEEGEDDEEGGEEQDEEDDEEDDEDDEDDDVEVGAYGLCQRSTNANNYRVSPRVSVGASRGATSSLMSRLKSTRKTKKSPRRTTTFPATRCTRMICKNSQKARIAMIANTASSTANAISKCTWTQKRRQRGSRRDTVVKAVQVVEEHR